MVSHGSFGGIDLTVGKGGLRFRRKASNFNHCVGNRMDGKSYSDRQAVQDAFTEATKACKVR